jgi:hypothetical protein
LANRKTLLFIILLAFGSVIVGCGGGSTGGGSTGGEETLPAKYLSWEPPGTYTDSSPLNPAVDLDRIEIYVKENGNFSDNDNEMAALSAIDQATGQVCTSFNLATLAPFISKGVAYHVSVRAVAKNGLKSEFSPSATFSF